LSFFEPAAHFYDFSSTSCDAPWTTDRDTAVNGRRITVELKGGFPMVDGGRNRSVVRPPPGHIFPDGPAGPRFALPVRCDHIALYALFSITVCRHSLMAGFRST